LELLRFFTGEHSITELMKNDGRTNRTKFRGQYVNSLLEAGYVEMTNPNKPTSSKQKYRLTDQGRACFSPKK
jgi:ATP-dependent DNA helicase RecG